MLEGQGPWLTCSPFRQSQNVIHLALIHTASPAVRILENFCTDWWVAATTSQFPSHPALSSEFPQTSPWSRVSLASTWYPCAKAQNLLCPLERCLVHCRNSRNLYWLNGWWIHLFSSRIWVHWWHPRAPGKGEMLRESLLLSWRSDATPFSLISPLYHNSHCWALPQKLCCSPKNNGNLHL